MKGRKEKEKMFSACSQMKQQEVESKAGGRGVGLRLFEDTFWIKTGEAEESLDFDGVLAVYLET